MFSAAKLQNKTKKTKKRAIRATKPVNNLNRSFMKDLFWLREIEFGQL